MCVCMHVRVCAGACVCMHNFRGGRVLVCMCACVRVCVHAVLAGGGSLYPICSIPLPCCAVPAPPPRSRLMPVVRYLSEPQMRYLRKEAFFENDENLSFPGFRDDTKGMTQVRFRGSGRG